MTDSEIKGNVMALVSNTISIEDIDACYLLRGNQGAFSRKIKSAKLKAIEKIESQLEILKKELND